VSPVARQLVQPPELESVEPPERSLVQLWERSSHPLCCRSDGLSCAVSTAKNFSTRHLRHRPPGDGSARLSFRRRHHTRARQTTPEGLAALRGGLAGAFGAFAGLRGGSSLAPKPAN